MDFVVQTTSVNSFMQSFYITYNHPTNKAWYVVRISQRLYLYYRINYMALNSSVMVIYRVTTLENGKA